LPFGVVERRVTTGLQFGIFDQIEPVPGLALPQIYHERLRLLERYDAAGFYAYHLAEHHTPAVHSLAPSQNVFLAAASQRTRVLRLAPCIYVPPLHHPLRLIEEICMLDHLRDGRLEIGVGRGDMDEYVATDGNYFVCSFQWGGLTHDQAMRSIDLFVEEIMPHYALGVAT
jgi:alkanesulfonate monooxygenase SsuD/methylene tetrahydromethanopterin reductase-like flavin-dependent oxidoreductase (luciferase family)